MKRVSACSLLLLSLLSGCATQLDSSNQCGTVSSFLAPEPELGFYRAVVTHLDGKPVISQPNYRLSIGEHRFTLAELIDSPDLKVSLASRTPKELVVLVEANTRYHLAAKFNQGRVYRGKDSGFWQPEVWQQEPFECEFPVPR
ncbi:hypothetical protein JK628_07320 [Shewanella sp. KX20019]|uniref:hypothetical protein n=1 Tax=Shewanella sp. KX20019 TaxID=2803864 RepID=UPI0019265CDD|nr:hypothetical protein [Shewanella sp. KX20019]QQX81642.1 hypothetical protein JK628_07320 [Shewanella sp. KX20019]